MELREEVIYKVTQVSLGKRNWYKLSLKENTREMWQFNVWCWLQTILFCQYFHETKVFFSAIFENTELNIMGETVSDPTRYIY